MTAYYDGLRGGEGRSEALRRAQLAMLSVKATSHPNLWASFIVSGRWSPLSTRPSPLPPKVAPDARGCACRAAESDRQSSPWTAAPFALSVPLLFALRRLRGAKRRRGGALHGP